MIAKKQLKRRSAGVSLRTVNGLLKMLAAIKGELSKAEWRACEAASRKMRQRLTQQGLYELAELLANANGREETEKAIYNILEGAFNLRRDAVVELKMGDRVLATCTWKGNDITLEFLHEEFADSTIAFDLVVDGKVMKSFKMFIPQMGEPVREPDPQITSVKDSPSVIILTSQEEKMAGAGMHAQWEKSQWQLIHHPAMRMLLIIAMFVFLSVFVAARETLLLSAFGGSSVRELNETAERHNKEQHIKFGNSVLDDAFLARDNNTKFQLTRRQCQKNSTFDGPGTDSSFYYNYEIKQTRGPHLSRPVEAYITPAVNVLRKNAFVGYTNEAVIKKLRKITRNLFMFIDDGGSVEGVIAYKINEEKKSVYMYLGAPDEDYAIHLHEAFYTHVFIKGRRSMSNEWTLATFPDSVSLALFEEKLHYTKGAEGPGSLDAFFKGEDQVYLQDGVALPLWVRKGAPRQNILLPTPTRRGGHSHKRRRGGSSSSGSSLAVPFGRRAREQRRASQYEPFQGSGMRLGGLGRRDESVLLTVAPALPSALESSTSGDRSSASRPLRRIALMQVAPSSAGLLAGGDHEADDHDEHMSNNGEGGRSAPVTKEDLDQINKDTPDKDIDEIIDGIKRTPLLAWVKQQGAPTFVYYYGKGSTKRGNLPLATIKENAKAYFKGLK